MVMVTNGSTHIFVTDENYTQWEERSLTTEVPAQDNSRSEVE
jgi:hypothetical protein